MPQRTFACALFVLMAWMALPSQGAATRAKGASSRSYDTVRVRDVAPGLRTWHLRARTQNVHVARLAPRSNLRIQPVPSRGNASGRGRRLETTSTLCRRVECLVAINGDFYREGKPVGGLVLDGRPIRPFRHKWVQAIFDPERRLVAGRVRIRGVLVMSDLSKITVGRVDPRAGAKALTVYTRSSGRRTPKRRATEAVFRALDPRGPLRIGQTSVVRFARVTSGRGRTPIPEHGMVVSARGPAAGALRRLAARIRTGDITRKILVRLRSNVPLWDSVGGRPVIVRDGRSVVRARDSFARARHPRTLVGRARNGSVLMVTVDGRSRTRAGMSLAQAARLMIRLGAVEAINLDGGGSTTFVRRGRVLNHPSDGRERPVAVALAVVRTSRGVAKPAIPRLSTLLGPRVAPTPAPSAASRDAAWPALVPVLVQAPSRPRALAPFAGLLLAISMCLYGKAVHGAMLRFGSARARVDDRHDGHPGDQT